MSEGTRDSLLRLADAMVEDVMAMSDEELMAEEFEDAADALMTAADYLKTQLDAGKDVYESKWLGAVMEAQHLLLFKKNITDEIVRLKKALERAQRYVEDDERKYGHKLETGNGDET